MLLFGKENNDVVFAGHFLREEGRYGLRKFHSSHYARTVVLQGFDVGPIVVNEVYLAACMGDIRTQDGSHGTGSKDGCSHRSRG